jgi:anti-anti-sigma factor
MSELKITKNVMAGKSTENGVRYKMEGRINTTSAEILDKEMNEALTSYYDPIILNMSEITLLTSVGIRIILKTYKQCEAANRKFCIERPSQQVTNVLGLSALEQMLVK